MESDKREYQHSNRWYASWSFFLIAVVCLFFSDLSISTFDPMSEFHLFINGFLHPSLENIRNPLNALMQTIAFALLGVATASLVGMFLALIFHWRLVRMLCAFIRSIHELFWALIFLQIFGLHPLTGLLAIGLPYAATFAKVYAEIIEESDATAYNLIRCETNVIAAFVYARLPDLWSHFVSYTSYRFECGLRSSIVLGFVGLPTIGYYLSTAFLEGQYSEVAALLFLFYLLILSIRFWMKPYLLPIYLFVSPFFIINNSEIIIDNVIRFFTHDIIPTPIRNGESFSGFWNWLSDILFNEALTGVVNTIILTQITLVATGILALLLFPIISKWFYSRSYRGVSQVFLVILRSTPEYILAFIFLVLWGPSMLPAIVALTLHNAAIIAHLMGRYSNELKLRIDRSQGLNLYLYEILPNIYGQFLAFLFYRWEIIMRETAILGILGLATLGFYIDSAIEDIRFDKAIILIIITAFLNIGVDATSRAIRQKLRLNSVLERN